MRPNPFDDAMAFMTATGWFTPVFWALLVASAVIAAATCWRSPAQRTGHAAGIWFLRVLVGAMWWQQSLWKIPPDFGGLRHWMEEEAAHAAILLQGDLVRDVVLPHLEVFGPLVYGWEVAVAVSLLLGVFSRIGALLGLLMAGNLWLGLYSAPNEWPWTYVFLMVIQGLFVLDPPGRCWGVDTLWRRGRNFSPAQA